MSKIVIWLASDFDKENNVEELVEYEWKQYVKICCMCEFVKDIVEEMKVKYGNILVVNEEELC